MTSRRLAGVFVHRVGLRSTAITALTLLAIGTAVILGPGVGGSAGWAAVGYGFAGIGLIASLVAGTIAATSAVDSGRMGTAGGLLNTSQFLGGAIGTALAGLLDSPGTLMAYRTSLLAAIAATAVAGAAAILSFGRTAPATKPTRQPVGEIG
jgi:MFS family permease